MEPESDDDASEKLVAGAGSGGQPSVELLLHVSNMVLSPYTAWMRGMSIPDEWAFDGNGCIELHAVRPGTYYSLFDVVSQLWVSDGSLQYSMSAYQLVQSQEPINAIDSDLVLVEKLPYEEAMHVRNSACPTRRRVYERTRLTFPTQPSHSN